MISKETINGLSLHPEISVYFNQNVLIDDNHLDCIWYPGKRLATVQFRDMFLDLSASESIELEGEYHDIHFNEENLFVVVPDDAALQKLRDASLEDTDRLAIRHENWLDYDTYDSEINSMLFGTNLLSVLEELNNEIEDIYEEHQKRTAHFVNWSKQSDRKAILAEVFNIYEYDFPTMSGEFDKFVTEKVFDLINNGLAFPAYGNRYRSTEPLIQNIRKAFCELDLDGENIRTFAMKIIANIVRNYSFLPVDGKDHSQQQNEPEKSSVAAGAIEYLGVDGIVERVEFHDESEFKSQIQKDNHYGIPMVIVIYKGCHGKTIDKSFLRSLDPPPAGIRIEQLCPFCEDGICTMAAENNFCDGSHTTQDDCAYRTPANNSDEVKTFLFTYSVEGFVELNVTAKSEEEARKLALKKMTEIDCGDLHDVDWHEIGTEKKECMSIKKYRVFDILYAIEPGDVDEQVGGEKGYSLYSDYLAACENKISEIEEQLPSEMTIAIEDDGRDIDEQLCDIVSDKTGYLIDSFKFEEV